MEVVAGRMERGATWQDGGKNWHGGGRSWQDGGVERGALHGGMEGRTGRRGGGTGWNFLPVSTHFLPFSYILPPSPPYFLLLPLLL
jgi:hypothetical protein